MIPPVALTVTAPLSLGWETPKLALPPSSFKCTIRTRGLQHSVTLGRWLTPRDLFPHLQKKGVFSCVSQGCCEVCKTRFTGAWGTDTAQSSHMMPISEQFLLPSVP